MKNEFLTESYDFFLPKELIAKYPLSPRDSSKLLVYDRKKDLITHTTFRDILELIPKNTSVLLNNTKVIKARVFGKKETGGRVELLLNRPLNNNFFSVYIRGKVKIGTVLLFDIGLQARVVELISDGSRVVQFFKDYKNNQVLDFRDLVDILNEIGHIPLPPYIDRKDSESDINDYQTVFAKESGAVAAPTASLHFTEELFEKLKQKFETSFITLNVGAGTFKPVDVDSIQNHSMHSEIYSIDNKSKDIIKSQKKILAVGTTVTRTVEYFVRTGKSFGECDLFLNPMNPPKRVDYLLTNFHLPKSTLIMLVASFIGLETTLKVYNEAIKNRYRFFSYGDAMLIL